MTTVTIAEIAGLHVGTVEACSATEIKVALESDAPQAAAFNTGQPQGFPRLNGYVLMPNESGAVVGLITQVAIEPGPPIRRGMDPAVVEFPSVRRRLYINPLGRLRLLEPRPTRIVAFDCDAASPYFLQLVTQYCCRHASNFERSWKLPESTRACKSGLPRSLTMLSLP